jgi:hypothetical protein
MLSYLMLSGLKPAFKASGCAIPQCYQHASWVCRLLSYRRPLYRRHTAGIASTAKTFGCNRARKAIVVTNRTALGLAPVEWKLLFFKDFIESRNETIVLHGGACTNCFFFTAAAYVGSTETERVKS